MIDINEMLVYCLIGRVYTGSNQFMCTVKIRIIAKRLRYEENSRSDGDNR